MIQRFRRIFKFLTPSWLHSEDGDGAKVLYSLGLVLDASIERLRLGLEARFPSRAGDSALALLGRDRGLLRGREEPRATFAARLLAYRTPRTHRVRGNAYEAVRQVWAYWQSWNPGYADVFDAHFLAHLIESDGTENRFDFGTWNWDGLSTTTYWARFWVTLDNDGITKSPDFGDPALWGGALGTPGYTLGQSNVRPEDVTAMRELFQSLGFAPAHALPEWVLVTSQDIGGGSFPLPDGTWNYWSKNSSGTRVAARAPEYRYWSLDPARNNTYGGVRSRVWPNAATQVDGTGTYNGDRTNAAAWGAIALPNGETYAGSRSRFPARVLLLDDGSFPQ